MLTARFALGVLLPAGFALGQEPAPVPSFEARVDLVTVDVVVLDKAGRPVEDLSREDFAVIEDGRLQEIATFEPVLALEEAPRAGPYALAWVPSTSRPRAGGRTFVLLVDDVGLAPHRQVDVRQALTRFVDGGLRPGDDVLFATTSGDSWWSARFPEGREDLQALFSRVRGRRLAENAKDAISEWEAFRIVHYDTPGGAASTGSSGAPAPEAPGPSSRPRPPTPPGSDTTQRVVLRYYDRRVCDPEPPAPTPWSQCATMVRGRAAVIDQKRANRTRDVLAAVDRIVFALSGTPGRKALLLLSEGFLNDPDTRGALEVAGRCREANLAVHSLDVRGLQATNPGLGAADWDPPNTAELAQMRAESIFAETAGSEGLAEETGGFAIRDTNDLGAGAVRVAEESRAYYLLGFVPPEGKGSRDWRKLRVVVNRPDVVVRARKGYTLRTSVEIAKASASAPNQRPSDVTRALLAPQERDDIPLRARAHVFEERPAGRTAVVLAVEADISRLANIGGARPRSVLSLSIAATHRDTGALSRVDQQVTVEAGLEEAWEGWLAFRREIELPAGIVQARVVVRDEFLGRTGATTLRFEVPPPSGLRLSTPVLSDRLYRPRSAAAPLLAVMARREFPSDGSLFCQFQVFGTSPGQAGSRVVSSFELRRAGGASVRRSEPTPIEPGPDGRLVRLLGVPLAGHGQGDYELVVRVLDQATGESREAVEPLRVVSRPR